MCDRTDIVPDGFCTIDALAIELTSGGVSSENIQMCMKKFNSENRGYVDFLDFCNYTNSQI